MKKPQLPQPEPVWLEVVREKVESLRFGVVQIVVHDSRVTLIERTEKTKFDGPPAARGSVSARSQPNKPTRLLEFNCRSVH